MPRDSVPVVARALWARLSERVDLSNPNWEWLKASYFGSHGTVEEIRHWWDSLGQYKDLQEDIERARQWAHGEVDARPLSAGEGVPHEEILQAISVAIYAALQVLDKYPNLLLFSPDIAEEQLQQALAYAIAGLTWNDGLRPLLSSTARNSNKRLDRLRADVWRIDWTNTEGPAASDLPVLKERLWQAHTQLHHQEQQLAIVITCPADATGREISDLFDLALRQARTIEPSRRVRKPGDHKDYAALVTLYVAAKVLKHRSTVQGWDSEKFKDAEKWLKRKDSSPIVLEQLR